MLHINSNRASYNITSSNIIITHVCQKRSRHPMLIVCKSKSTTKPSIQAESMVPDLEGKFDISLYTSAAYIIIVVAAIVTIVAFFGCFGAMKVSKSIILPFIVDFLRRVNACLAPTSFSSLQRSLWWSSVLFSVTQVLTSSSSSLKPTYITELKLEWLHLSSWLQCPS